MLQRITEFLASDQRCLGLGPMIESITRPSPQVIFPGSFAPLHAGHRGMAEYAAKQFGVDVQFEISVTNVDKPPLTAETIDSRLQQFHPQQTVWLTKTPRFVEKAFLFPGAIFVLGVDTLCRLLDARYYGSEAAVESSLRQVADQGCRFLVFGRLHDGQFLSPQKLPWPHSLPDMMDIVPEADFRLDISSSEIRELDAGA